MKIATYNIASGGFISYQSTSDMPERMNILRKAIREINADIIGLSDTFRWKDTFSSQEIQQTFDYPYTFHIDMNDTRVDKRIGLALMSRHPIVTASAVRLNNRDAIKATIKPSKSNQSIDVFVVYLDDLSESTRQKQAEALAIHLANDQPSVIVGDFNALWPEHAPKVKQQIEEFIQNNPSFIARPDYEHIKALFQNFYETSALPFLKRQGCIEPLRLRPTALTKLHPLSLPAIFPVDHILTKGCVASDYFVYNSQLFETASDHYPLSAMLDVK